MKKILIVIFVISFFASFAFGDEVKHELSTIANEQIRTYTRAMVNAGIPGDEAVKVTRMMIQNKYQNQNIIRAQQILIATAKENLPVNPVVNKVFEGIAKNAPENSVVQAMEKARHRYSIANKHAEQITKNKDQKHNIAKAIAEGLTAGIHNTDMLQVMNRLRSRTQQITKTNTEKLAEESFLSLRDMARLSVPSELAKDVVCHALNQQYSYQDMKKLRHSFMSHSMSTNPVKLANRYSQAISHAVRAENLSSDQIGKHTPMGESGHQGGSGSTDGSSGNGHGGGPGGGSGGGSGGGPGGGGNM